MTTTLFDFPDENKDIVDTLSPAIAMRFDTMPPKHTAQHKGAFVIRGTEKIRFYTKASVRIEAENVVAQIVQQLPVGWLPLDGPLAVDVKFVYPYRKSEPMKRTIEGRELPHDKAPDLDNLAKGLLDAATTAQVWKDDAQLCDVHLHKRWGKAAYWTIKVWRVLA